jgi:hypothetical protein
MKASRNPTLILDKLALLRHAAAHSVYMSADKRVGRHSSNWKLPIGSTNIHP